MAQTLHEMLIAMPFPNRLAETRKTRGLTQEALGDSVGLTKLQIYRYEKGTSQPTLDVLKKLPSRCTYRSITSFLMTRKETQAKSSSFSSSGKTYDFSVGNVIFIMMRAWQNHHKNAKSYDK